MNELSICSIVDDIIGCGEVVTDCTDDYLLAKMMQLEFDKEHDVILKQEESKYNGDSKGMLKLCVDKFLIMCHKYKSTILVFNKIKTNLN